MAETEPARSAPYGYGADLLPTEEVTVTASRINPVPWWAVALGLAIGAGLGALMQQQR